MGGATSRGPGRISKAPPQHSTGRLHNIGIRLLGANHVYVCIYLVILDYLDYLDYLEWRRIDEGEVSEIGIK